MVAAIEKGDVALPEFQRDYKWPDDYILELVRSIARGWPIGTFLMLKQDGKAKLPPREIKGAPKPKAAPGLLILDGQQRATAVYHALSGKGGRDTVFFANMGRLRKDQAITDECLDATSEKAFKKTFGADIGEQARSKVIRLTDLASTSSFNTWLNHVADSEAEKRVFGDLKDEHLSQLTGYPLRLETVGSDLPIEAVAKIFERTNRSVLELDAFDLMVAILYPSRFKLRDKWSAAKTANPILNAFGVSGLEVLKVIALREHLRQHALSDQGKLAKMTVRGVRQDDVLALEPRLVIREWAKAVKAYVAALELVRDNCGVIRRGVLPQATMLLPLADALYDRRLTAPARKKLIRWFWATVFTRAYARGANTQAVTDTRTLRAWLARGGQTPDEIENFTIQSESLREIDDGNEIVVRGVVALLNTLGAKDWAKASAAGGKARLLVDTPESTNLEIHHVFPLEFLESRVRRARAAENVPANQVLIDAGLNGSLRNASPSSQLGNSKVVASAIASHLADRDSMRRDNYDSFVKHRARKLASAIQRTVVG